MSNLKTWLLSVRTPLGFILVLKLQLSAMTPAHAGPPLAIDDPGILDPGVWELILAGAGESRDSGHSHQLPILDVSYGLAQNTQISLYVPWELEFFDEVENTSDIGHLAVGYKWRFYADTNTELAIAPAYAFSIRSDSTPVGESSDTEIFTLPLLWSQTIDQWTLLGQLAWNHPSEGDSDWSYGLALVHPLTESADWMVEIYGDANNKFEDRNLNFQVGLDYSLGKQFHLLAAVGSRLNSGSDPDDQLKFNYYLGLQWFSR